MVPRISVARLRRGVIMLLCGPLAVSCGGGGGDDGGTEPEFDPVTLSLSATILNVGLGQSRTVTVSFTRQGSGSGAFTLGVAFQPQGMTVTFDPPSLTGRSGSSTLTIAVAPDAAPIRVDVIVIVNGTDIVGQPPKIDVTTFGPIVMVTKSGSGSGTVTSNPAGINCGSSCSANFRATPLTLTATTAAGSTFAGWSGACVATTTTCSFTPTISPTGSNAVNVIATFTLPGFSMAVAPTSLSVPQGASGTATVSIARAAGFTGPVNLGFVGVPAGITIAPNPVSIAAESATITISAALSLGVGNYPITINATAAGVPQQTASLGVQVTPSPGGNGNITFSFASCDPTQVPIWFAVRDGNGPWTRVIQGTNSTFTFGITSVGGIAFVTREGNDFLTTVRFLSAGEALSIATGSICAATPQIGTRGLMTSVASINASQTATVTLGGASTMVSNPSPPPAGLPFTLGNFPEGRRDLIASRWMPLANGQTQFQRLVIRRNTEYAHSATPPSINFAGPESFVPSTRAIDLGNLAGDQSSISESFLTVNGLSAPFFESVGTFCPARNTDCVSWGPVPDSLLQPGDFHAFSIVASPQGGNVNSARFAQLLLHAPPAVTPPVVTFGPPLATPVVTSLGTTPYVRMRAQLPSQAAYNAAALASFTQDSVTVEVLATATYLGGAPATWTIDIPDFSGAGYDPIWGGRNGVPVEWVVMAAGGTVLPFLGAMPVDGAQFVAGISGSPSTLMGLGESRRAGLVAPRMSGVRAFRRP